MPKEETQFKKGKSGNPNGRPKKTTLSVEIAEQTNMSQVQCQRIINRIGKYNKTQMEDLLKDKNTSFLELSLARIWTKAAEYGDPKRLDYLLNLCGIVANVQGDQTIDVLNHRRLIDILQEDD